jgi:hypothetical protein
LVRATNQQSKKRREIDDRNGGVRAAMFFSALEEINSEFQEENAMTVTLNRRAYEHAKDLISEGRIILDERDAWSEHRPSAEEENAFIRQMLLEAQR